MSRIAAGYYGIKSFDELATPFRCVAVDLKKAQPVSRATRSWMATSCGMVASVTISMGMLMLPPVLISLPFKLLLFVLVDGWSLVMQGVVGSFH